MQDCQLLVLQEGGGNQTCSHALVLFSVYMYTKFVGGAINLRAGWEISVLPANPLNKSLCNSDISILYWLL